MKVYDISLTYICNEIDFWYMKYQLYYFKSMDYTPIGLTTKINILYNLHGCGEWNEMVEYLAEYYFYGDEAVTSEFITKVEEKLNEYILGFFPLPLRGLWELKFCYSPTHSKERLVYITNDEWDDDLYGYFGQGAILPYPNIKRGYPYENDYE